MRIPDRDVFDQVSPANENDIKLSLNFIFTNSRLIKVIINVNIQYDK